MGRAVTLVQEPGGTPLGERVRTLLKHETNVPLTPDAELLLFSACRAQVVHDVLCPALARGEVVIADRFTGSTFAYQGYGRGIPLAHIADVQRFATGGLTPALTLLLDIDPAEGASRRALEGDASPDRFEGAAADFRRRVAEGYRTLAAGSPDGSHWACIDGRAALHEVAGSVWRAVAPLLGRG